VIKLQHYYGEQSCTAGRAAFVTGQHGIRTGLTKVGFPGAPMGMSQLDPSIGGLLKNLGYATGQFGKNHLGDRNESLPTVNGFDEFFGNLYHLNAEKEPQLPDYPRTRLISPSTVRVACSSARPPIGTTRGRSAVWQDREADHRR
jgi:arylsulfatase A-like enzyme